MSATAGVNVKMGVSGVQQFKQAMKESQAAVKTLDAELKLNEQNLKANGDAQHYMETKTRLLQEQIRLQTDVVNQSQKALEAMAKNGVKESSTAFQQMKQQSLAAQAQLVQLQNELDGVGTAGGEAANELSGIGNQLDSINRNTSWSNISDGIEKLTDKLQAAGRAAFEMGKKIVQATLSGGQWADDLATTATQWEMTPEQVYRMQQTANIIDTSAETIFSSRKKLIAAMGKESDKETMGAFAALGITDLTGSDSNIEDVFWGAGEALMKFDDKVARNEYAMKLFGRSWEEMIPIFQAGRKTYEDTMASWSWMGDDQFDNLTKMNDEQMKLNTEWENFQHQFEAAIAPALTEVMTVLQNLLHEFNTYLQTDEGQKMLTDLGDAVKSLFGDLKEVKPAEVMEKIKSALDSVKAGLEWITANKDTVVKAIEGIAAGFGMLKLGGIASDVLRITNGLKGLRWPGNGGGNTTAPTTGGGDTVTHAALYNTATKVAGGATNILMTTGGLFPALGDRWMNETNAGRAVRDGGDVLDGISQDIEEKTAEVKQNASTFVDDWSNLFTSAWNNQVAFWNQTFFGNPYGPGGGQQSTVDGFTGGGGSHGFGGEATTPEDLGIIDPILTPDKWREVMGGGTQEMSEISSNWYKATDDMTEKTTTANNAMTDAAKGMTEIPAAMSEAVERAVVNGMSQVTIVVTQDAIDTMGRHNNEESGAALLNY